MPYRRKRIHLQNWDYSPNFIEKIGYKKLEKLFEQFDKTFTNYAGFKKIDNTWIKIFSKKHLPE